MSSLQNAATSGNKSMKFANALDPFSGFLGQEKQDHDDDDGPSGGIQQPLSEQFDNRLRIDQSLSNTAAIPTNQESQQPQQQQCQQQQQPPPKSQAGHKDSQLKNKEDDEDDDSDFDDDDDDLDDDPALEAFRQKRLAELRQTQMKLAENKAKGHGEVREISQDEFLPQCTSSQYVAVHFYHKEFERCTIMDHHLKKIASQHLSCKFVRVNAEKAPFFVVKLKIQTLPTLVVFKDGKEVSRLVGFEDLADATSKDPDDFPTSRLGYWLEKSGAMEYEGPQSDDDEEYQSRRSKPHSTNRFHVYDEDI
jgi:thiol-disulfide isomerase/thioredoxin